MKAFMWDTFEAVPLVGILRGFDEPSLPGLIRACIAGGLTTLEVTMNSPGAAGQIRQATRLAEGRLNIGAGTVLTAGELNDALVAGASFIVTPGLNEGVVRSCLGRNIPIFPGVFSPTEIARAVDLGVGWVKLFPGDTLGIDYIRAIRQSFPTLKLLPTGGASLEALPDLIRAGADGFGIGRPLFPPERIVAEEWGWLENRCRAFVQCYRANRNGPDQ